MRFYGHGNDRPFGRRACRVGRVLARRNGRRSFPAVAASAANYERFGEARSTTVKVIVTAAEAGRQAEPGVAKDAREAPMRDGSVPCSATSITRINCLFTVLSRHLRRY